MLDSTRHARALDLLAADMADVTRFSRHLLVRPLRAYQADVARAVAHSVRHQLGLTFACMMSRQAGKNETAAHLEAFLLNTHRRRGGAIVKASPTFKPQTINSMLRLQTLVEHSLLPPCDHQHGYMLAMGAARCIFYSAGRDASVVGATADILLEADEAQDIDREKWDKDFRPMGASTNATSILWGTPWTANTLLGHTIRTLREQERRDGLRRIFLVPWQVVAAEVPAYGAYVRAEIDRLGPQHPLIRTQYLLQEIDAQSVMFPPDLRALIQADHPRQRGPQPGAAYVMLIDVAGEAEDHLQGALLRELEPRRDSTALTICQVQHTAAGLPRYLVRDRYRWTGTPHAQLHGALVELARRWQPQALIIDATGVGAGLASFLRASLGDRVIPFTFTRQSKSRLGWDFLALCTSGRFLDHAPDGSPEQEQFQRELAAADYIVLDGPERLMRWGVPDPAVHDDLLISAALCAAVSGPALSPSGPSHIIEAPDALP